MFARYKKVRTTAQLREAGFEERASFMSRFYGCNSYIDREIGRVLNAVEQLRGEDTAVRNRLHELIVSEMERIREYLDHCGVYFLKRP